MIKIDRAVLCILSGIVLDVLALALFKELINTVHLIELVVTRSLVSLALLVFLRSKDPTPKGFVKEEGISILLRSMAGGLSLIFLTFSLSLLSLYVTLSMFYTAPLFSILAAKYLYKSLMRPEHILGIGFSLGGCILCLFGGPQVSLEWPVLWALAAAMLYGFSLALTKKVRKTSPVDLQIAYNLVCLTLVGPFVDLSFFLETPLSTYTLIGSAACFNVIMNYCYIQGYKRGNVIVLSILEYFSIPLGAFIGFLVWKEIPETQETIAACFIIIGGIIALRKEKRLSISS